MSYSATLHHNMLFIIQQKIFFILALRCCCLKNKTLIDGQRKQSKRTNVYLANPVVFPARYSGGSWALIAPAISIRPSHLMPPHLRAQPVHEQFSSFPQIPLGNDQNLNHATGCLSEKVR